MQTICQILTHPMSIDVGASLPVGMGLGGVAVKVLTPTAETSGSNLELGASCWKVGSYLPMPSGL